MKSSADALYRGRAKVSSSCWVRARCVAVDSSPKSRAKRTSLACCSNASPAAVAVLRREQRRPLDRRVRGAGSRRPRRTPASWPRGRRRSARPPTRSTCSARTRSHTLGPCPRLRLLLAAPVDLLEAVGVEGQAHDLVDEPLAVLVGERGAQPLLELRRQLTVDGPNQGVDGRHTNTLPSLGPVDLPLGHADGPCVVGRPRSTRDVAARVAEHAPRRRRRTSRSRCGSRSTSRRPVRGRPAARSPARRPRHRAPRTR